MSNYADGGESMGVRGWMDRVGGTVGGRGGWWRREEGDWRVGEWMGTAGSEGVGGEGGGGW